MSGNALYAGSRRGDIDVARSIAAFLVVTHHLTQYFIRYGVGSFNARFGATLVQLVEYMHITTFMLAAGILLGLSNRKVEGIGQYLGFVHKKAFRLMLPFVSVSVLHLLVKVVAPGEDVSILPGQAIHSLIQPRTGLAGHMWFLYCLMSIFLLWPGLQKISRTTTLPLLLVGMFALAVLPIPWPGGSGQPLLGLKDVAWFLPILTAGFLYGASPSNRRRFGPLAVLIAGVIFVGCFVMVLQMPWQTGFVRQTLRNTVRMLGNVSAAFFVLWLSGLITTEGKVGAIFSFLGKRSYDIYLLHVALVAHPLAFVLAKAHPGLIMTYVLFVAAILAAYAIPIGIGKLIRHIPSLAFVMLGVPMKRPAGSVPAGTGNVGT